jgi:hypothetical protein
LLYAPPGLRKKRKDIVFDAELGSRPSQDWGEEIDQVLVHGNLITTEVVFFHVESGSVLAAPGPVTIASSWPLLPVPKESADGLARPRYPAIVRRQDRISISPLR